METLQGQWRMMRNQDVDSVFQIESSIVDVGWSKKNFSDCLQNQYSPYVLVSDSGDILAYYIGQHIVDEYHLLNIGVAKYAQKKGIGRQILKRIRTQCLTNDLGFIFLEVRQSNENAQKFYHKSGFYETGVRPAYYPTKSGREDAILMACPVV